MTNLNIAKLSLAALAFAALAPAQESKETPKPAPVPKPGCCVQQVYQVKHGNAATLYQLLYTSAGQGQTPILRHNESLNVISVYGTVQEVNSIVANLKALDVPSMTRGVQTPRKESIELTTWILSASTAEGSSALPETLTQAVSALREAFGFRSYTLLAADVVRILSGQNFVTTGNAMPPQSKLASRMVASYEQRAIEARVEDTNSATSVRLRGFVFSMQAPYCTDPECRSVQTSKVQVNSTFRVREGQQVVVGQSKLDGSDKSLILIVSAKVVD